MKKFQSSHRNQLEIPVAAHGNDKAIEILRVWSTRENQDYSLQLAWEDPKAWGVVFADLLKNIARAYEQVEGRDFNLTLERICFGLVAELESPTDDGSGAIIS